MTTTIGIAGLGAIGGAVAKALQSGITGFKLAAASETDKKHGFNIPIMNFEDLSKTCDLIIECLPPAVVPNLTKHAFEQGRDIIMISACALLIHRDINIQHKRSNSRIIIPSGALCGIDGVTSMAQIGITSSKIATTKPPQGYKNAPYITKEKIALDGIKNKTLLFKGNAIDAAKGFPANINVAATLSLAGIGAENTNVEIWADPDASGNTHEITVTSEYSTLTTKIENKPDPNNPKTSILAAQSIIRILKGMTEPLVVL